MIARALERTSTTCGVIDKADLEEMGEALAG
jgi:hypothetical protein